MGYDIEIEIIPVNFTRSNRFLDPKMASVMDTFYQISRQTRVPGCWSWSLGSYLSNIFFHLKSGWFEYIVLNLKEFKNVKQDHSKIDTIMDENS